MIGLNGSSSYLSNPAIQSLPAADLNGRSKKPRGGKRRENFQKIQKEEVP